MQLRPELTAPAFAGRSASHSRSKCDTSCCTRAAPPPDAPPLAEESERVVRSSWVPSTARELVLAQLGCSVRVPLSGSARAPARAIPHLRALAEGQTAIFVSSSAVSRIYIHTCSTPVTLVVLIGGSRSLIWFSLGVAVGLWHLLREGLRPSRLRPGALTPPCLLNFLGSTHLGGLSLSSGYPGTETDKIISSLAYDIIRRMVEPYT